jgi:hypothetical protein
VDWETVQSKQQQELDLVVDLGNGQQLTMHYASFNGEASIRVFRMSGQESQYMLTTRSMAGVTLEQMKEFALRVNEAFEALKENAQTPR